ncbi:MAG: hypothetical protein K2X71_27995 [Methylobacterium sp.]|uniref:hypothetical protein n=1 Tax=Methylobacterium sp. TaxID=409 RepID=UPI002586A5F4|nr:hypothetical protein [Methylobacterium sp.]MBY0299835.1 hypothetical protein [Methylobacterium sp.]
MLIQNGLSARNSQLRGPAAPGNTSVTAGGFNPAKPKKRKATKRPKRKVDSASGKGNGDFFTVDLHIWRRVCELNDINLAIAYLVLARGTQGDMCTTSWSTNAIERRTGIARLRAKAAIEKLIGLGFAQVVRGGAKPRYRLAHPEGEPSAEATAATPSNWVYLPNSIVDGVSSEVAPVELIRQTRCVRTLQLFVELYHAQNLNDDGGIHCSAVYINYTRRALAERGGLTVWGFDLDGPCYFEDAPFAAPFMTGQFESYTNRHGTVLNQDRGLKALYNAFQTLHDLGLITQAEHVVDGIDQGEIIHPCALTGGEAIERQVAEAAHAAGAALLTNEERQQAEGMGLHLVPLPIHLREARLVGVIRLRHAARTTATLRWKGRSEEWEHRVRAYREITEKAVILEGDATSMGDQRGING